MGPSGHGDGKQVNRSESGGVLVKMIYADLCKVAEPMPDD